jgi:hypothetical protein
MKNKKNILLLFTNINLLFLSSCAFYQEELEVSDKKISPVPISEIQERLNLTLEQSIERVTQVLESHLFSIPGGFTSENRFSTNSIKIKDQMCQGQYLKNAPLPCEIKIHGVLIPKSTNVTIVRLLYKENCLGVQHIESSCKNSNAENLLFTIVKELKN